MGSECSTVKSDKSGHQPVYTMKYNFSPSVSPPAVPTATQAQPCTGNCTETGSRKSWQGHPPPVKKPWKPDNDLTARKDPTGKYATKPPLAPHEKSNEFATFSPDATDDCSNFGAKPVETVLNLTGNVDENDPKTTEESPDEETIPAPNQPRISVDYRDVSQAREALKQRLAKDGQAWPLANGDVLETMHKNKRKKTQIKGGEGQLAYECQRPVALLVRKFEGKQ